jgi:hypothetical protein
MARYQVHVDPCGSIVAALVSLIYGTTFSSSVDDFLANRDTIHCFNPKLSADGQ